jgi:hypothetical protein
MDKKNERRATLEAKAIAPYGSARDVAPYTTVSNMTPVLPRRQEIASHQVEAEDHSRHQTRMVLGDWDPGDEDTHIRVSMQCESCVHEESEWTTVEAYALAERR